MSTVKVWDPLVRLFHWGLALAVLGSFLTSDRDALVPVHVRLGLGVFALVVARLAWGVVGPRPARFTSFVRGPREVLAYAREMLRGRPRLHLSHNPLGGAMVVALLGVLLGLAASGAIVYAGREFEGPLTGLLSKGAAHAVKEVHEALSGALLALAAVHVVGVLVSSLLERQNLVLGMITGRKRAPDGAGAPAERGAWTALLRVAGAATALALGVAAAFGLAVLLGLPVRAGAASPLAASLLREYEASARAASPAFAGFSAAEGRRIYTAEHLQDGQRTSCATCHTDDPRRSGRTPAGKVVEPLAPSANPARLTDRADVEKWFRRNCTQVLGRECTAEEKGHFVTYLLSPAAAAASIDPTYAKECGACHLAYPPRFLPAASWRETMAGLDRHFGQNAGLDQEVRARLEGWLVERSGEASPGAGRPPLRITGLPWFRHEHDEVPAAAVARPAVRSMANCAACHPGAERWDFDEDRATIPRG